MAREAKKKKSSKLIALSAANKAYEFKNPLEKRIKYMGKPVDIKLHEDPNGFSYIVWKNKKIHARCHREKPESVHRDDQRCLALIYRRNPHFPETKKVPGTTG